MKIAIPTADGKLCAHFGHCESFTFAEIDEATKEIKTIEQNLITGENSCGGNIITAMGMVKCIVTK